MRKLLLLSTVALAFAAPAVASDNTANIRINLPATPANTPVGTDSGSVTTLTVTQGLGLGLSSGNRIGTGTANDANAFRVWGPWNSISLTQNLDGNSIQGVVASGALGQGNLSISQNGNDNSTTLTVGTRSARPLGPNISITIVGSNNNTTDTLDTAGNALTLDRTILGSNNDVVNDLQVVGALNITESITGLRNLISRGGSGSGAATFNATVIGNDNDLIAVLSTASDVTLTQTVRGNDNTLTANFLGAGTGTQTVTQSVNTVALPASLIGYNNNTLTATLTNTGAGSQSLVQSVDAPTRIVTGGFNNNTLTAVMIGTDQTVEQRIITTEVGLGNFLQSPTRSRSQNNVFNVTTLADGTSVNARWGGSNGTLNITQTATATGASVVFTGYGSANLAAPAGTVTILQTGEGNQFNMVATAAPGQPLMVMSTQN